MTAPPQSPEPPQGPRAAVLRRRASDRPEGQARSEAPPCGQSDSEPPSVWDSLTVGAASRGGSVARGIWTW
eukprot:3457929-Rhodomonas_salina.1